MKAVALSTLSLVILLSISNQAVANGQTEKTLLRSEASHNWTLQKARSRNARRNDKLRRRLQLNFPNLIPGVSLPKYVTSLVIPPVLYDDRGNDASFEISLRQFQQQILPDGYPKTTVWGYGNPNNANTFHHPSFTVEVTQNKKTTVVWRNELVRDPIACTDTGLSPDNTACYFLPHVVQDRFGTPIIDASLHWAAPNRKCLDGSNRTDCEGANTDPYYGPVPMVPHVHGAHTEARSDGFPHSWFLPKASNIPNRYSTEGSYFRSRYLPSAGVPDDNNTFYTNVLKGDEYFRNSTNAARGQGYAVFRYTNDQETTALWYHDHSMGLTRLNVYAAGAGFWNIRTASDGEARLAPKDIKGRRQVLPGPPVKRGQDPNGNFRVRKNIREHDSRSHQRGIPTRVSNSRGCVFRFRKYRRRIASTRRRLAQDSIVDKTGATKRE